MKYDFSDAQKELEACAIASLNSDCPFPDDPLKAALRAKVKLVPDTLAEADAEIGRLARDMLASGAHDCPTLHLGNDDEDSWAAKRVLQFRAAVERSKKLVSRS